METDHQHPPVDLDAERALIGIVMTRRSALDDLATQPGDFHHPAHGALWWLLTTLHGEGAPTDPVTVKSNLNRIDALERQSVTPELVLDCYAAAPAGTPARHYAQIVDANATRRRLLSASERIAQLAQSGEHPAELVEMARAAVDVTRPGIVESSLIGDDYTDFLESLEQDSPAVPTPWGELNGIINGWIPGALYVVAARPSIGKTILAVQAAIGLSEAAGYVALTSLEMSKREIQGRITSQLAKVATGRLKGRAPNVEPLSVADWDNISKATPRINALRIDINTRASTVTGIRSHARTTSRRGPLAGIVVDYLGLVNTFPGDKRSTYQQVSEMSRQFKALAMEMQVPVILVVQLNRANTQRTDPRPQISDLRDSGQIEADADVVLLLHADSPKDPDVDLLVAKNRHGPLGVVNFQKQGHYSRFIPRPWKPGQNIPHWNDDS